MLIPNLKTSAPRTADAEPANGKVVSTHTNERGSSVCDRPRAVPEGCSQDNIRLSREPSSPAVADDRIVGKCANETKSCVHNRTKAKLDMDVRPLCSSNVMIAKAPSECDANGPLPEVTRLPTPGRFPDSLAVAEWGVSYETSVCRRGTGTNHRSWTLAPRWFGEKLTHFPV